MDQLALQSTFSKVQNPYGLRRWGNVEGSAGASTDWRLAQLFGVFGQPYGEHNAPMLTTRVTATQTVAYTVPFRDQWERPATRWFKADLMTSGSDRIISVASGTPFLAVDPIQTAVEYRAKPGDDVFLDDGAGNTYVAKISDIDPLAGPGGNSVTIVSKTGSPLPADATYYVKHTLDAFLVRMTTTYMLPQSQIAALNHAQPFQAKLKVTYYDNGGTTVVETYNRTPIKALSTLATDVDYAFIEVVGDRFGVATAPATPYYQIFETFEVHLARVPDKLEVVFGESGSGAGLVDLGNVGVYYGLTVPALATPPASILTPDPAPTTRYNLYPPPSPEDFWTGSGDICIMPVGTLCPAGYEDIAQTLSRVNDHFVTDLSTGLPITFAVSTGNALTMALTAAGNTQFSGVLPATAVDPSDSTMSSLRGSQNNTSTWEIVFMLSRVNSGFREDQNVAFRIPEISIDSAGNFTFELIGDIRPQFVAIGASAQDCRIFISGIARADALGAAGTYEKPFQDRTDATPVDSGTSPFPPIATELGIPIEDLDDPVLVTVNDVIEFVDDSGNALAAIDTGGSVFTGPTYVITAINTNEGTVTVEDLPIFENGGPVAGRITEVWRFCGDTATPSVPQENNYRVFSATTSHNHVIGGSDAEMKARKDDGSFVTSQDHTHAMSDEAIIAPYTQFKFCVKL